MIKKLGFYLIISTDVIAVKQQYHDVRYTVRYCKSTPMAYGYSEVSLASDMRYGEGLPVFDPKIDVSGYRLSVLNHCL